MIKIYGASPSSAGRCLWLLEEIGVPYEQIKVDLRDPEGRAKYEREVFAGGKIPFMVDGDVKLFESAAINAYLVSKYKPDLIPAGIEGRALVDQWSYWALTNAAPEIMKVLYHTVHLPEDQRDSKIADQGRKNSTRYLTQLENSLHSDYLLGAHLSLADIHCGSVINLAARAELPLGPKTTAWLGRLTARPAFKKAYGA